MMFRQIVIFSTLTFLLLTLVACGGTAQEQAQEAQRQVKQAAEEGRPQAEAAAVPKADLDGVKSYLLEQAGELKANTTALKEAGHKYYELAEAANFDYAALWQEKPDELVKVVEEARAAWLAKIATRAACTWP